MPVWEVGFQPFAPQGEPPVLSSLLTGGGLGFGGMVSPLSYLLSCGLSLAGAAQPSFRCFQRKQFHVLVVGSQCSWEEVRTWPSDVSILNQNLISCFVLGVFGGGTGVCVHVRACVHVHVCLLLPVSCVSDAIVVVCCFFPPLVITWTRATGRQIRIRSSGE